jgi:methionyl-tRNA formyltransferase
MNNTCPRKWVGIVHSSSFMVHKIRTIFFGTPEFAVPSLEALKHNARFEVIAVVTQPDRPIGRKKIITPSPVKIAAEKFGIPIFQPEKLKDETIVKILGLKSELAVVVAYGNLIPKLLLDAIPNGFVNIHPSLLPKHRGASPLTAAILEGDKETGVCLMKLDEGMDHGPVIACRRLGLNGDETTASLGKMLSPIGAEMINNELVEYLDGKIDARPQDHDKATFCKLIKTAASRIDWNKPVAEIERLVRAMSGVTPASTTIDSKLFLIHRSRILKETPRGVIGTLSEADNGLAVICKDGYLLLDEVQLAGGKPMSGQAFLNGRKDFIGKIFE